MTPYDNFSYIYGSQDEILVADTLSYIIIFENT